MHSQNPKFRFSKIFIPKFWQKIKAPTLLTVFSSFTSHFSPIRPPAFALAKPVALAGIPQNARRAGATHVGTSENHRLVAFTLAEVLITLGIVGIVAAMTLPTVIDKSQKYILKQQFKKSYSILSQALLKSEADLGYTPQCYYYAKKSASSSDAYAGGSIDVECSVLREAMFKNLSIIQKCENHAFAKHCIPEYIGFEKVLMNNNQDLSEDDAKEAIKSFSGWNTNNILNRNPAYVLKDGTIIIAYFYYPFPYNFAVDINGKKGPNKWGYDLFPFLTVANSETNLILLGYGNYPIEKGGTNVVDMLKQMHK